MLSNFDSNPLIFDNTLFPGKNSPNIAKSNRVFPGKGRRKIFGYPNCWNFSPLLLIYFDFGHLHGDMGGQSWTKNMQK